MKKNKVIIVDDQPENLALLGNILQEKYELSFAKTGEEALTLVLEIHPALILLDVNLPDLSGYDVCRKIKSNPIIAEIPIIFVTGYRDIENESLGFQMGAVDYITKPVSPPILLARVKTHISLINSADLDKSYRDAIHMLGEAGHYNDDCTGNHIWRMAAYAKILAKSLGWSDERAEELQLAAPMHDTGKIGTPDYILQKPAKLDEKEWEIMREHSEIGHAILSKSDAPLFKLAAEIARYHHEKWDGTGYPHGLIGLNIPESARIVAVADVFDALTMKRPYKEPWALEEVIEYMQGQSGKHFDPVIIQTLVNCIDEIIFTKNHWEDK